MTGGPKRAEAINARLAEAAQHLGIALAVGSQRAALEADGPTPGLDMALRLKAPDTPILANIGAAQLTRGFGRDEARRAMDMIGADALVVHLNPLQEACQPEGDRDWWGVGAALEALVKALDAPVVVKETGAGISAATARRLAAMGVAAIDGPRGNGHMGEVPAHIAGDFQDTVGAADGDDHQFGLSDTHAKLEWTAPDDGTFEIRAGAYQQGQTGAYALTVAKQP